MISFGFLSLERERERYGKGDDRRSENGYQDNS